MNNQTPKTNLDIHAIDKRLTEISAEKETLLRLRKQLLQQQSSPSNPLSSEEKLCIFQSLFKGRSDIFATRWENQKGKKRLFCCLQ